MGMFNSIYADLFCPKKNRISKNTEIQIKWQGQEFRLLNNYHLGDTLEGLLTEYNNTWIRTDYICNVCSKFSESRYGHFIKIENQKRHYVFIKIKNSKICDILIAREFRKKGTRNFVNYF